MGSPFKTAEEYIGASGTIHSFTGHPAAVAFCLVVAVLLTVYFLYRAYAIHH